MPDNLGLLEALTGISTMGRIIALVNYSQGTGLTSLSSNLQSLGNGEFVQTLAAATFKHIVIKEINLT